MASTWTIKWVVIFACISALNAGSMWDDPNPLRAAMLTLSLIFTAWYIALDVKNSG